MKTAIPTLLTRLQRAGWMVAIAIAFGTMAPARAQSIPARSLLAYTQAYSECTGGCEAFCANPNASVVVESSWQSARPSDHAPSWSPDGQASQDSANEGFLLFTSDRANPSTLGMCPDCEDIYVMSPDGTNATRLTRGGADAVVDGAPYNSSGADWSHSKKLIAFQSNRIGGTPQVHLMNPDGSEQTLLVSLPRGGAFPSFSQSGNELCFHSQTMPRRDIYLVNVHGTGLTNLTSPEQAPGDNGVAGDNLRCDWSPKSSAIAFTSNRHDPAGTTAANRNDEIYVMNADGSDVLRLTGGPGRPVAPGADANPAWSPKGDRIAFESNRDSPIDGPQTPEIYVMNADGSEQVRLTYFALLPAPSNVNVTKPTWSPKGDRISFHRRVGPAGERGHIEVYTMNADGSDITQVTFTQDPGFSGFPSWGKWTAAR